MTIASEPVVQIAGADERLDAGIVRFLGLKGKGEGIRLKDIRSKAATELKLFGDELADQLASMGVTVPPAIQLCGDDDGKIVVLGEHFSKEKIATFINGDMHLLKRYKEVEVLHDILRKAELRGTGQTIAGQQFNLGLTSLGCIAFFTGEG